MPVVSSVPVPSSYGNTACLTTTTYPPQHQDLAGEMSDAKSSDQPGCLMSLPDELLEAVVQYSGPSETIALGACCRRTRSVASSPLLWRRHCVETWRSWHPRHDLAGRLTLPPATAGWQRLYNERARIDRRATTLLEQALSSRRYRFRAMAEVAGHGADVVDLLTGLRDGTPDTAADVLARRYHATAVLGQIHRAAALATWTALRKGSPVELEAALGAFDQFVLAPAVPDLDAVVGRLDGVARDVRAALGDVDAMPTRPRALAIAEYLQSRGLVGMAAQLDYHAVRNNFITTALREGSSLPLQSVAVYCAVARRLGVDARPSNYPRHVHAVVESPPGQTLDGGVSHAPEHMYLDPWRTSREVSGEQLHLGLLRLGIAAREHGDHLGPAGVLHMTLRTARNLMVSVEEARQQAARPGDPDVDVAWYAMLWVMVLLGDGDEAMAPVRRRQFLPYLLRHFQARFPEDVSLVELLLPLFVGGPEREVLLEAIEESHSADDAEVVPRPRGPRSAHVQYGIGHHLRHRRYGYEGFIIGWDEHCSAGSQWIEQMRVDELPRGRYQPFYNVLCVTLLSTTHHTCEPKLTCVSGLMTWFPDMWPRRILSWLPTGPPIPCWARRDDTLSAGITPPGGLSATCAMSIPTTETFTGPALLAQWDGDHDCPKQNYLSAGVARFYR